MAPIDIIHHQNELHGRGTDLFIITLVLGLTSLSLALARIDMRIQAKSLGRDDLLIVLSEVFLLGFMACNIIGVINGFGKAEKTLDLSDVHTALQVFYTLQILYKLSINSTKIAILALYLRIFPNPPILRKSIYGTIVYVVLYGIASILVTVFQCHPIAHFWDKALVGTCINALDFWYAGAAFNILGDVLIFALPLRSVYKLQIPKLQKRGLYCIFGLGIFTIATSGLRIWSLTQEGGLKDVLFSTLNSTIWTTVEANTAVMCACLPMQRRLLSFLFPKIFPPPPSNGYAYGPSSAASQQDFGTNNAKAWGPLDGDNNPQVTIPESSYGMGRDDIPLGRIKKTTQVNVQEAEDQILPIPTPSHYRH